LSAMRAGAEGVEAGGRVITPAGEAGLALFDGA
jgi:hypothetical protein